MNKLLAQFYSYFVQVKHIELHAIVLLPVLRVSQIQLSIAAEEHMTELIALHTIVRMSTPKGNHRNSMYVVFLGDVNRSF